jgi:hypothetical protein
MLEHGNHEHEKEWIGIRVRTRFFLRTHDKSTEGSHCVASACSYATGDMNAFLPEALFEL